MHWKFDRYRDGTVIERLYCRGSTAPVPTPELLLGGQLRNGMCGQARAELNQDEGMSCINLLMTKKGIPEQQRKSRN